MILTLESATSTIMPNGTRLSKVFGTMMPTVHQLSLDCPLLAKSTLVKYCKYCKYCMNSLANPKSTLVQYCKYYTDRLDTPKSTWVQYCKYCTNNPKSILCSRPTFDYCCCNAGKDWPRGEASNGYWCGFYVNYWKFTDKASSNRWCLI